MTPLQADAIIACLEIASLEDIIRSKEAANRPRDLALPILRQLLRELKGD